MALAQITTMQHVGPPDPRREIVEAEGEQGSTGYVRGAQITIYDEGQTGRSWATTGTPRTSTSSSPRAVATCSWPTRTRRRSRSVTTSGPDSSSGFRPA